MKGQTILIVDDEETVCEAMKDLLEIKKYKVHMATNGVSGLKICSEEKIDLIVLDLNMPRMDGYMFMEKLAERWQHDNRKNAPPILILTAVEKNKDLGLAQNLGAIAYMQKPFKNEEFLQAIKNLLEEASK